MESSFEKTLYIMDQHKSHILIVDDDIRILKLLKQFLTKNEFLVSTAMSANEAANLLARSSYELILLDVMLPNITGFEFAKSIKSSGNVTPIVMLTALSDPLDRKKAIDSGASDYITKPFEPKELLMRIRNLINDRNN